MLFSLFTSMFLTAEGESSLNSLNCINVSELVGVLFSIVIFCSISEFVIGSFFKLFSFSIIFDLLFWVWLFDWFNFSVDLFKFEWSCSGFCSFMLILSWILSSKVFGLSVESNAPDCASIFTSN